MGTPHFPDQERLTLSTPANGLARVDMRLPNREGSHAPHRGAIDTSDRERHCPNPEFLRPHDFAITFGANKF
jgi:hypothetical protein